MSVYAPIYENRAEAGEILARHLPDYANREDGLVLGLVRGGMPVAYAVAQALGLPLDLMLVRKLGVPGREELAFGAIASGVRVLNERVVVALGLSAGLIEDVTRREQQELARREALYRGEKAPLPVEGRTLILVDDGLATGASMRVAVTALGQREPARIVVAVPVAAASSVPEFDELADDFVCPLHVELLHGVGYYYRDFGQVSDGAVRALLAGA